MKGVKYLPCVGGGRWPTKFITVLLFIAVALGIMAIPTTSAVAQALPLVFFDENGTGGGTFGPLPTGIAPDPLSTGPPAVTLFYAVPYPLVTGDLQLTEPGTGISDLVRFENQGNSGLIYFYSDNLDGGTDAADVGLPTLLNAFPTVIAETGPETNNGALYIPSPGGPGFPLAGPPNVQYNIISDVPEPGSVWLVGLGSSLLVVLRRRR
jgi:hypothetical protein